MPDPKNDSKKLPGAPQQGAPSQASAPPQQAEAQDDGPAPADPPPAAGDAPDETARLRERLDLLERERARFADEWEARERAHQAQLRAARSNAPGRPRDRGEVVEFKANHRLMFTAGGEPVAVGAGEKFRASLDDLAVEGLVEGDHFSSIGG